MDKKVNVISDIEHELEVTLAYDEIKPEIEEAYKEERKTIHIDGFRKGKVPMPMLKKMFGEAIEYKASEKISNKKFWDIVEADNLKPISTPTLLDINFEMGKELSFKVRYEVKPKLALKDYKGLEIEKIIFEIKDEDIDREIEQMVKMHSSYEETDVVSDTNHRIVTDLQRYDDEGKPVEGSTSNNMVIDLSDEKVNPQIPENATGKKVGETFDFVFRDDRPSLKEEEKEEYKYTGTITKIEKMVAPEINEEFVKKISQNKAATIEEFKGQLRENISNYYTAQSENMYTNNLLSEIVKNNDFTAPKGYVEFLLSKLVETEKGNAQRQGHKNFNELEARTHLYDRAEWNAKWQIVLENLVEAESIKVDDSDLEKLAKDEAVKLGISEDKLLKYYKDSNRADQLLEDKVIEFLKENNTPKEISAEEKAKQDQEKADEAVAKKPKKTVKKTKTKKAEEKNEKEEN